MFLRVFRSRRAVLVELAIVGSSDGDDRDARDVAAAPDERAAQDEEGQTKKAKLLSLDMSQAGAQDRLRDLLDQ
jgi:hypothetical protein